MLRKLTHSLVIGLAAAAVSWLLWSLGSLNWVETSSWDWRVRRFARPGPATEQIRLIILDQDSLDWGKNEQKWPWPWPRIAYSAVADFCARGGAKAVVFDFLYTEPSFYNMLYTDDDLTFGSSLAKCTGSVVGVQLSFTQGDATNWPPEVSHRIKATGLQEYLKAHAATELVMPKAAFPIPDIATNCTLMGNVFATSDDDKVIRRLSPFQVFGSEFVPSLSVAALLAADPSAAVSLKDNVFSIADRPVPLDQSGKAILRYRGHSQTHKTVSIQSVIQSEIRLQEGNTNIVLKPEFFKDCYVLIGSSAPALMDLRASPLSPVQPGVEIHATFLDNLLSGDLIRDTPRSVILITTLLFALVAALAGRFCQQGWQAVLAFAVLLPLPLIPGFVGYQQGYWMPVAPQVVAVALSLIGAFILNYTVEGRQKRFIKTAFKQYLSPHVIERLVKDPKGLKLGGETRELSIYFSDIQGFTTISESLTPEQLTALLNEYLTAMSDIIMEEGGTVDKYEGDAVIAFWNAPLDLADHARCAVRAALRCQRKLSEIRQALEDKYGKKLFCRIGLNTGKVVIGNMGSHQRFNYTFLGDAGNLAARLEGANKQFGTFMMISEFTRAQIGDEFAVRELARLQVKGKLKPVEVFEPMYKEDYEARRSVLETFSAALAAYYEGKFQAAYDGFSKIADQDAPARSYLPRCKALIANPPTTWNGVLELTEK